MSTTVPNAYFPTANPTAPAQPPVVTVPVNNQGSSVVSGLPKIEMKDVWDASYMTSGAPVRLGASAAGAIKMVPAVVQSGLKGGAKVGMKAGFLGGLFKGTVARSIGSSAIVAIPMSLITNFIDYKRGKITAEQRNTLMVADAVGYTASGAIGSAIGGAVGSAIFPGLGTVLGIGAGIGLGYAYERWLRPRWKAAPPPANDWEPK